MLYQAYQIQTDLTSPTLIGLRWGVLATWWAHRRRCR